MKNLPNYDLVNFYIMKIIFTYVYLGSQMFTFLCAYKPYTYKSLNENVFKHIHESAHSVRNKLLKKFEKVVLFCY